MISLAAVYFGLARGLHCIKSMKRNTQKGESKMETTEIKYNEKKGFWQIVKKGFGMVVVGADHQFYTCEIGMYATKEEAVKDAKELYGYEE